MSIDFEIPIRIQSAANLREHWAVKAKRVAAERRAVAYRIPRDIKILGPLLRVSLVRRAPRKLDGDNLQSALKAVRDQVASALGVDDKSQLVAWDYGQETGEPAVLVSVRAVFDR